MGPLLDLAVIALAGMVCVSLALLAWTLGVSIPLALRRVRLELVVGRLTVARAERRLQSAADDVRRRSQQGQGTAS